MYYSKKKIDELLNHVCITKIISTYIKLRQRKNNKNEYKASCPFHEEKTPSFTVTIVKQFYHCFGCGAHGNAIKFIMEYQGLNFLDATNEVARIGKFYLPNKKVPRKKKVRDRKKYRHNQYKKINKKTTEICDNEYIISF